MIRSLAIALVLLAAPAHADVIADVVVTGDSMAEHPGRWDRPDLTDWTALLASAGCDTTVINIAVGGKTLRQVAADQARRAGRYRPEVAVLFVAHELGGAATVDAAVDHALGRYAEALDAFRAAGVAVLVLPLGHAAPGWRGKGELSPYRYGQAVRDTNAALAEALGSRFVAAYDRMLDATGRHVRAGLTIDGLHLTAHGYRYVAAALAPALAARGACEAR